VHRIQTKNRLRTTVCYLIAGIQKKRKIGNVCEAILIK
jgi:hypothetical protein